MPIWTLPLWNVQVYKVLTENQNKNSAKMPEEKKKGRITSPSSAECMRNVLIPLRSRFVMKHQKCLLHLK